MYLSSSVEERSQSRSLRPWHRESGPPPLLSYSAIGFHEPVTVSASECRPLQSWDWSLLTACSCVRIGRTRFSYPQIRYDRCSTIIRSAINRRSTRTSDASAISAIGTLRERLQAANQDSCDPRNQFYGSSGSGSRHPERAQANQRHRALAIGYAVSSSLVYPDVHPDPSRLRRLSGAEFCRVITSS